MSLVAFEDQPSLIEGNLVVCSVQRKLTALDPATGEVRWRFNPQSPEVSTKKCRGISSWVDEEAPADRPCKSFIGYTLDDTLRAFDLHSGEIPWQADLPAAGTSISVTYEVNGEQYIVIPAGGHRIYGSTMGDSVVAYKLKR